MIDPQSLVALKAEVSTSVKADNNLLDQLRQRIRPLKQRVRRIHPYSTTALSIVATDGGNNRLQFDPFLIQLIRVVDSSNAEYCLETVTPRTPPDVVVRRHLTDTGDPLTAFGRMMAFLNVSDFYDLSMISRPEPGEDLTPSWVQVYRDLMEWAILFDLVRNRDFASDTLIMRDGLLRSKLFAAGRFRKIVEALDAAIADRYSQRRRRIYLAGVAKSSVVLQTYQLAMALEGVLRTTYPCFVEVPREVEKSVYRWGEWAGSGVEGKAMVGGKMFFVKFGSSPHDPVWPIDLLESQSSEANVIFGYLLADAQDGFPVPFYPQSLQRAHDNAALTGFDMEILQEQIYQVVRDVLGKRGHIVEEFRLRSADVAGRRYS